MPSTAQASCRPGFCSKKARRSRERDSTGATLFAPAKKARIVGSPAHAAALASRAGGIAATRSAT
jgi:hypothetical protein